MQALYAFLALSLTAAACFIIGAFLLAGWGAAILTAGGCSLAAAALISRGMKNG